MRKKFILSGLFLLSALAAILGYHAAGHKKETPPSQAFIREQNKMEGVSIKKRAGNATLTINAAVLRPWVAIPASFLTMVLNDDTEYNIRLRNVRFHLTENAKNLLIAGPEALTNTEFTAFTIRKEMVLSNNGYFINPNAAYIHIRISGNKVKVSS